VSVLTVCASCVCRRVDALSSLPASLTELLQSRASVRTMERLYHEFDLQECDAAGNVNAVYGLTSYPTPSIVSESKALVWKDVDSVSDRCCAWRCCGHPVAGILVDAVAAVAVDAVAAVAVDAVAAVAVAVADCGVCLVVPTNASATQARGTDGCAARAKRRARRGDLR
jgi:hypothetical protein